jgi:hypothetical protein
MAISFVSSESDSANSANSEPAMRRIVAPAPRL